jgi:hypothetical protein
MQNLPKATKTTATYPKTLHAAHTAHHPSLIVPTPSLSHNVKFAVGAQKTPCNPKAAERFMNSSRVIGHA